MAMRKVVGKKMGEMMAMPSKAEVMHPTVSIPIGALPEAKDWKIGKTYHVALHLRQIGAYVDKGKHGESGSAQFEIIGIDPKGEVKGKTTRYA